MFTMHRNEIEQKTGGTDYDFLALDAKQVRQTIGDMVYFRLRAAIAEGYFSPGERLIQDQIAKQMGVSRSPVREAIRRLQAEGLLEAAPNQGVVVINMTPEEAAGLYDLREVLEGLAARLAAMNITSLHLERLQDSVQVMEEAIESNDPFGPWVKENTRFHEIIVEAGENRKLAEFLPMLRESIGILYRTIRANPARITQAMDEHKAILSAIAARNPDEAERLGRLHIVKSKQAVIDRLKSARR